MPHEVIRSALRTEIFDYVCACPNLQLDMPAVRNQFTCLGYDAKDINMAVTDLETDGSVTITDDGRLKIGVETIS